MNTATAKTPTATATRQNTRYWIGIDPGVMTGLAIWDAWDRKLLSVRSFKILDAQKEIETFKLFHSEQGIAIRIEDARLRTWFGKSGPERHQGAGSIKRDCQIWEDYLKTAGIPFQFTKPKSGKTKLDSSRFFQYTGWKVATNEHSRDAAMLVFGI